MVINITWKTILSAVGAVAAGYILYKGAKAALEEQERLNEHKEEALGDRNLYDEVCETSFENDTFDADEKADAYKVLSDKYEEVKAAHTIEEFDTKLGEFDNIKSCLLGEDKDKALASLIIFKDRLEKKKKQIEDDKRKDVELKKAKIIAEAISSATGIR